VDTSTLSVHESKLASRAKKIAVKKVLDNPGYRIENVSGSWIRIECIGLLDLVALKGWGQPGDFGGLIVACLLCQRSALR
jgi:hypothetical protein